MTATERKWPCAVPYCREAVDAEDRICRYHGGGRMIDPVKIQAQAQRMASELLDMLRNLHHQRDSRAGKMNAPEWVALITRIERIETILRDGGVIP